MGNCLTVKGTRIPEITIKTYRLWCCKIQSFRCVAIIYKDADSCIRREQIVAVVNSDGDISCTCRGHSGEFALSVITNRVAN